MRCGSVELDQRCPGPYLFDNAVRDLADQPIGHGHEHDVGLGQCLVLVDAVDTDGGIQALAPLCRDLDMVDLEARAREVGGEADAHLSASAEQSDLCHLLFSIPFLGFS